MKASSHSERHYIQILAKLLGEHDEIPIRQLLDNCRTLQVDTGQFICRQGNPGESLFIVLSGRCRAMMEQGDAIQLLGDIAEGEPFGEFALFTKEPRSASVFAIRPSVVLEIDEATYLKLISLQPALSGKITRFLIARMNRNNQQKHLEAAPKNVAVITLQPEMDIGYWTDAIRSQFEVTGVKVQILEPDFHQQDDAGSLYQEMEESDALNFMFCNAHQPDWSRQCMIYADLVVLVTDFYAPAAPYDIEQRLGLYESHILRKKLYLVLLHPENGPQPENTARWFQGRKVTLHIHLRKNHAGDIARFCRIVTHQAVGLVLGGGGAKGFAHVGAVKAIIEAGIPIDVIGGTSAGALYGLAMAFLDFHIDRMEYYAADSAKRKLTSHDYTLPIVSIMTGNKMTNYLKSMFGTTCIEDFWISAYCVSTNYSAASMHIHTEGPAWKQVQASIAIPGVFPPVVIDGALHVDGGVMDNLPIEPMYRYPVRHIIAVALSGLRAYKVKYDETPSVWSLLRDKITRRYKYKVPPISALIINSLTLNSKQRQEQNKSGASLYVELDLAKTGMLDDSRWKKIMDKGYAQMQVHLQSLKHRKDDGQSW